MVDPGAVKLNPAQARRLLRQGQLVDGIQDFSLRPCFIRHIREVTLDAEAWADLAKVLHDLVAKVHRHDDIDRFWYAHG
jgi:hypothetical protein